MKDSEVLGAVAHNLRTKRWGKHQYHNTHTGARCVIGMFELVANNYINYTDTINDWVIPTMQEMYPEHRTLFSILYFNDLSSTKRKDVLAIIEKAQLRAAEAGS